jgi:hypothetical protein
MPGVDSTSASAYPHASDQTIVGYILIALIVFAAMLMIFRSLFKLVRAARRLDRADLKSAAAVTSEGDSVSTSTSAGAGSGNYYVRSAPSSFVFLLNVNRSMVPRPT